jgi:hypothetical protein
MSVKGLERLEVWKKAKDFTVTMKPISQTHNLLVTLMPNYLNPQSPDHYTAQ